MYKLTESPRARMGAWIRQLRLSRGISIELAARALDVAVEKYEDFETGKTPIPLNLLAILIRDLSCDLEIFNDFILGLSDEYRAALNFYR